MTEQELRTLVRQAIMRVQTAPGALEGGSRGELEAGEPSAGAGVDRQPLERDDTA